MRVYLFWGRVNIPDSCIRQWEEWSSDLVRIEQKGDISALVVDTSVPKTHDTVSEVLAMNRENMYKVDVAELLRLSQSFTIERVKLVAGREVFSYAQVDERDLRELLFVKNEVREARLIAGGRWVFYSFPFFLVRDGVVLDHLLKAIGSEWRERAWKI